MNYTSTVVIAVLVGFGIVHGLLTVKKNKKFEVVEKMASWGEDQDFWKSEYKMEGCARKKSWSNQWMNEGSNCWGQRKVRKHKRLMVAMMMIATVIVTMS